MEGGFPFGNLMKLMVLLPGKRTSIHTTEGSAVTGSTGSAAWALSMFRAADLKHPGFSCCEAEVREFEDGLR